MIKYRSFIFILLFTIVSGVFAQKSPADNQNSPINEVESYDQWKFDYFFYEALKEKNNGNYDKCILYYSECLKLNPQSSVVLYEIAKIHFYIKSYEKSEYLLEKAISIDPDNKWYLYLLSQVYQQDNKPEKAIQIYDRLYKIDPSNEDYLYIKAQLYTQNKSYDKAIDIYNQLIKNNNNNSLLIIEKASVYTESNNYKDAINCIEKAIKQSPKDFYLNSYLADLQAQTKNFPEALKYYKISESIDSTNADIYFRMNMVYDILNDSIQAKHYFLKGISIEDYPLEEKFRFFNPILNSSTNVKYSESDILHIFDQLIKVNSSDSRSYQFYAEYLVEKKDTVNALNQYKNALNIDPTSVELWSSLLFLELNMNNYDLMYVDSKNAVNQITDNSLLFYLHGLSCNQLKKYTEAESAYLLSLKYVDQNLKLKVSILGSLGDVSYQIGKKEEAFKYYDEALSIDDKNIMILNNFSYYLSLEERDLDKAEKMSSKCIQLEPGNATYLDTYAWILFMKKNYFEAKYVIELAIQNGGSANGVILEHYGDILFFNSNLELALEQWNKAYKLGSEDQIKLLKKINEKNYIK